MSRRAGTYFRGEQVGRLYVWRHSFELNALSLQFAAALCSHGCSEQDLDCLTCIGRCCLTVLQTQVLSCLDVAAMHRQSAIG